MFAIAVEQRQYETYILTDEASEARLEVVPGRGGIMTQWQIQGEELFYLDFERFKSPNLSVRGGNPILFPICGNLPDNTYTHQGQTYSLKQHGFAREMSWRVSDRSTDGMASLTVQLESNQDTKAVYPFDFLVEFTYQLKGNSLTIGQRYTNRSQTVMPFSAGFHPYFLAPDKSKLQIEIPGSQFDNNLTKTTDSFRGQFDFNQDEIDAAFRPLRGQQAKVVDQSRGLALTVEFDALFTTLVFWTVKGKDFYCLEPWTSPRNALNTGTDLLNLAAGETLATWVKLNVTDLRG